MRWLQRESEAAVRFGYKQLERCVHDEKGDDERRWGKKSHNQKVMKASCMATLKTPSFISSLCTSRALKKKMQSNGYGEQQWGKGGAAEEMGRGRAANTTCKHAHLLQQICQEKK